MIDVVIAGAGPAGLSAAIACSEHGLRVKIIDEFMKPGGRLLGQLHQEPDGIWWNGIEEANKLHTKAKELGVDIQCGTSIYDIKRGTGGWTIYTTSGTLHASALLLATGAAEISVPIPGWTLPGVMSIGAAQVMTNVHRVKPGEKGVIVGINILSVAIARELQLAGIEIDSLVLPGKNPLTEEAGDPEKTMQAMTRLAHLAPSILMRFGAKLLKGKTMEQLGIQFYPKKGMKIWGMPVRLRTAALEIYGEKQVEGIRLADIRPSGEVIPGTERTVPVDFVCIAGGLYPLAELAAIGGCSFQWIPSLGGHVPVHNERMQTTVDGLYVAGNITGIESAKVAIAQGKVAGLSIAFDRGVLQSEEKLQNAVKNIETTRNHSIIQFHPEITKGREHIKKGWEQFNSDRIE